jgi:hypothetical protein
MFVHLLSDEFQNYVNISGNAVGVSGSAPGLNATFDVQGMLGGSLNPGQLRNGAKITIRASDGNMLRPQTSGTTRRVFHDGDFVGNSQFHIVLPDGKANAVIRNNQTVTISVPIPFRSPRWVTIDRATSEFRVGPASHSVPAEAARFKLQTVPQGITVAPLPDNPVCMFGQALTAPTEGLGQLGFEVTLDREAPAPSGSSVNVSFSSPVGGSRLSREGANVNAPRFSDAFTVIVPAGQSKTLFFVIGIDRPNPCLIFNNLAAAATRMPPVVMGGVRVTTMAIDGFRHAPGGDQTFDNTATEFTGVTTYEPLKIAVNGEPLKNRVGLDDPVEQYGAKHSILRGHPDGVKVDVASMGRRRFKPSARYTLALGFQYIDRPDFPLDSQSVPPTFAAPGALRQFSTDSNGQFQETFQLRDFQVRKTQILCVTFVMHEQGTAKAWTNTFAIQVDP